MARIPRLLRCCYALRIFGIEAARSLENWERQHRLDVKSLFRQDWHPTMAMRCLDYRLERRLSPYSSNQPSVNPF